MPPTEYNPTAIEERWQREWEQARLFEPKREEGKRKFFLIFAYPGISGYLHVGHMRGYSYCDAIARYHRQLGEAVLFPAGFHASGIPAVSFARKVERGDEGTLATLRAEGTDEAAIAKLKDPAFVVSFFSKIYEDRYWRKFGFSIDYSRLCSTIDPGYSKFIQWQFRKLHEKGLLVQKPHFAPFCPVSGPVAVDPSETDVSRGGDAEVLQFTALKFRSAEGVVYPCATLRPETVFGATNLWVNPAVEYVLAEVQGERWVLSPEALRKADLLFEGGAREVGRVPGRELVGREVKAPLTGAAVRVFPASFVDPAVGTGVVMSVPGHAPYDLAALEELGRAPGGVAPEFVKAARPIVIIRSPGSPPGGPSPAEAAVRAHKVASTADRAALDKATEDVYTLEFHQGRMLENTGAFAGATAAEARERVVREAVEGGGAAAFPEFSMEVICRCGQQVLIKRIPDQWFIRYSDDTLTEESARHASTMSVTPTEYGRDLPATLRWFADRACIRQGAWLGTPFPLDEKWIIEPISDSTLYPAFYMVTPYINDGKVRPQDLGDAFFDFVFLGRGEPERVPGIAKEVVEACRRDFLYWYPLDLNLGGKEHKTVHFPAFVKNHVAILAQPHWPRGIFVNFWVTQTKGEKLSKSKGGAQPVAQLASKFGVDALRLYYAHAAAPWLDIEWDPDGVVEYRSRLARIHDTVRHVSEGDLASLGASAALEGSDSLDRWLRSALHRRIEEAQEGWRELDFRQVATPVYFGLLADLRWYLRRGGRSMQALKDFARPWAALMAPITPHLAEELHKALGAEGFASAARVPRYDQQARDAAAEEVEAYLTSVLEDTQRIRAIAESFAAQGRALQTVERAAGHKVRGELVGLKEPLELPARVAKDVSLKGEKVPLLLSGPSGKVVVLVQARRAATAEDIERALRAASGAPGAKAWLLALAGAPQEVRDQAKEAGVLLTGPAEFELLAAEAGQKSARPQPARVVLVTREPWKARAYVAVVEDALKNGKPDPGRVLKALSSDAAFRPHMKAAPKVVQDALKDVSSLKVQALRGRAGGDHALDEYRVLEGARAFLAEEFGCPVEVLSADNPAARDERLRGKADAAGAFRPAIAIEY